MLFSLSPPTGVPPLDGPAHDSSSLESSSGGDEGALVVDFAMLECGFDFGRGFGDAVARDDAAAEERRLGLGFFVGARRESVELSRPLMSDLRFEPRPTPVEVPFVEPVDTGLALPLSVVALTGGGAGGRMTLVMTVLTWTVGRGAEGGARAEEEVEGRGRVTAALPDGVAMDGTTGLTGAGPASLVVNAVFKSCQKVRRGVPLPLRRSKRGSAKKSMADRLHLPLGLPLFACTPLPPVRGPPVYQAAETKECKKL